MEYPYDMVYNNAIWEDNVVMTRARYGVDGLVQERCNSIANALIENIWEILGILLIGPLGINSSDILIEINTFSLKNMHLKMSAKWCLFRLSLNELNQTLYSQEASHFSHS